MTPTPEERTPGAQQAPDERMPGAQQAPQRRGVQRVVISGMSGLYPQANHVKDLEDILYNKKNPITSEDSRWNFSHPEVSHHTGKVPHLDRFDAQFFRVHYRLGNSMDAMNRKVLEHAYQAIYDAGVCPEELSGKNVAVYIGCSFSETEKSILVSTKHGLGLTGCSKTMFANRISYWLNAKGPSLAIDDACCSSLAALEQAYDAVSTGGECEAAIVGGANLCLHPQPSVHHARMMKHCMDGKTKSFDQNADSNARSEAINVLFLQRVNDAKRIYAEVLNAKTEFMELLHCETGPKYGFCRDPATMAAFIKGFYKEAGVTPQAVEYVEAFGSAVPEADKAELEALDEVYCKGRSDPLLVGSVMSNIGFGGAASGISAVTKVLLGYHNGMLPSNLHCANPRQDVQALREGRMKIVTDHQRFRCTYTAVNGISVTGMNAHVLLHGLHKPKDSNRYKCAYPRLVTISGRHDTAVANIIDNLKSRPVDPEELALFHNIHQTRIIGHLGRGYVILDTDKEKKTIALSEASSYFDDARRPLWFVYSGMGSQWAGMGEQLMRVPVFAAAIERCRRVLEPKGVDIVEIITSPDNSMFNNILHSFVGIAAIQIGLTDILTAVGIVPDKIIGHSVGELGCAYADGCFTAEEMILAAYFRGLVSVQTPFIKGSMAAVGIGYQEVSKLIPPEIEVACHNGPESSTISGPSDIMKQFVAQLTAQGIFAKEVPCSNIAYHSRYIVEAGPSLLKYLKEVIKKPKLRSERWLSTSIPEEKWNEEAAKYSSAEYHTNNLLSSVLFEETSAHIPSNAVLIEIAPHALLQAILKRSLPESCICIPMTRRKHHDNAFMVLDAIGKLYMEGYHPKVQAIYPQVSFPVSTGTPMLSHLVEWAHEEIWMLPMYMSGDLRTASICNYILSTHDDEYQYLNGHVIRGKTVYPFSAALVAAWDTLSMWMQTSLKELSVTFRDVHFYAQPRLHDYRNLKLSVIIHQATGKFEIMDENCKVATGTITAGLAESGKRILNLPFASDHDMEFDSETVYQMLSERDYFYSGDFRSINKVNVSMDQAEIVWKNNWVTFLDGMMQLLVLRNKHDTISQPSHINQITINTKGHIEGKKIANDGTNLMVADIIETYGATRCGGVVISNVKFHNLPKAVDDAVAMKCLKFVPRFNFRSEMPGILEVFLQVVSENTSKEVINVLGIQDYQGHSDVFRCIHDIKHDTPEVRITYDQIKKEKLTKMRDQFLADVDLVLVQNLSPDNSLCQLLYRVLRKETFIINAEDCAEERTRPTSLYKVISTIRCDQTNVELIRWRPTDTNITSSVVTVRSRSDLPMLSITRSELPKDQKHKLIILSSYPPVQGVKDMVKKWRREADQNQIYLVMVSDADDLEALPDLDLAFNVLNDSVWGGEYYTTWQDKVTVPHEITLRMSKIGNLDSLYWEESAQLVGAGVPVMVHYAAINDIDVKRATGVIPFKIHDNFNDTAFGMDFSGVTDDGQRVMGILPSGAVSGRVTVRPELMWPVPDHWTLEEAATVPSAYAHALYCLTKKVKFARGLSVLVHGGTGALGQAVISIALAHGCQVFATVSDVRKKRFLIKRFPSLKHEHIGNSRDNSFGDMVLMLTNGKGCSIIFCCVKGEKKDGSVVEQGILIASIVAGVILRKSIMRDGKVAADFGVMFDIAQIQSQEQYSFGMDHLSRERSYTPVDFLSIFSNNDVEEFKNIQSLICDGISRGYITPLTHTTFAPQEVARAFRLVAASRHRGRALVRLRDSTDTAQLNSRPRMTCTPDHCQLVLGEQDMLALQFADRLISRGARKLRLHFTTPPSCIKFKTQLWKNLGVTVQVSLEDLTSKKGIISLLTDSSRLGTVEGIYIIRTKVPEEALDQVNTVVANLDLAARKMCPSVRFFSVVSESAVGQQTCLSRMRNGLPATALQLSTMKQPISLTPVPAVSMPWRAAVNAVERAVCSALPVTLAHAHCSPHQTILEDIIRIADIQISKESNQTTTLSEMGIAMEKVPQIWSYLRDMHNIALSEDDIQNLNTEKINRLEVIASGGTFKNVRGLSTFFSFIDPDELLATTEIVFLPTLIKTANIRDDEFDVSLRYLIIIPGLEGHHERFRTLCERLKLPALVLQPGLDFTNETPRETAQRYVQVLLRNKVIKNNFHLLGYEGGVQIALEVAAILEGSGMTGTIFCVGGTPEEFHACLQEELREYTTKEDLQNAVARHMFGLMTGSADALDKVLDYDRPWKEKIESCISMLLGRVAHSSQYARALIHETYMRIEQAKRFRTQVRSLLSQLVLLHAAPTKQETNWHDTTVEALQKYSSKPVIVEELGAPFAHAVYDIRCPSIINRHLDSEILSGYEKHNLCEPYLLDAGVIE